MVEDVRDRVKVWKYGNWMNEWVNEWMNERNNNWLNEQTNEWINEWIFDMNKKQSSLRPPMSCVLLVYAVYFSLLIFSNHFFKKTTFVSTSWIVVNVLREAWQDLRPKLCESSNEARVALGSEEKFAYVTRFNATCFERQLETLVRTERILYISHWFLLLFHWIFS